MSVLLLELNEVNFDQVSAYAVGGKLPTLSGLIERHGLCETTSEQRYDELEPWIQWVTAHTGLSLSEHGVYRLGDIVGRSIDQIWEVLERQGLSVGAISPMNANNRCNDPAFFMPDPWTDTTVTGAGLERLYRPVAIAVNGNANAKMAPGVLMQLALGLGANAKAKNYTGYMRDAVGALRRHSWRKAMLLDRLLTDVFTSEVKKKCPDFASLFLNAGAHIQHHYMFNSSVYGGDQQNPGWYVSPSMDPVLEVYELYDRCVAQILQAFPSYRIMIATGLHQDPHGELTLYWRLRQHAAFLHRNNVPFLRVEPRMSRDFVIVCTGRSQAEEAQDRLERLIGPDGQPLFSIDNRGCTLFVELIWSHEIEADFIYHRDGVPVSGFSDDVAFVAIKNGEHNGIGYFLDTGLTADKAHRFPLAKLPARIAEACGAEWPSDQTVALATSPA